ncbi:hypothetical protein [Spongiactinospora sp. TRM90649]|uniref:hypothetical protein n=1 Tax=Spongiactinospora sp. TRM90649 TaxID=3031114 RepID=UPI0023F86E74|nr:hypothetical protein [Spongiactinospora sp. TRM90649]MDF5756188.1 hypothetical protein [Spongiactinospora sp. TRM90649]
MLIREGTVGRRGLRATECRRELLNFVGKAESLGLKELFLPIIYAPIRQLDDSEDSDDEIVSLIRRTQYSDWRQLRLLDENSSTYREAVNHLATRLVDIADALQENPPELPTAEGLAKDAPIVDGPGIIDIMADAEAAIPIWVQSMEDLVRLMHELQEAVVPMAEELRANDQAGKGFTGRLQLMRKFATQIDPIADRLMAIANRYADQIVTINPAVLAAIRELQEGSGASTAEERATFIRTMSDLAQNMYPVVRGMDELVQNINRSKNVSRDLSRPLNKLTRALSSLQDGYVLIEQWTRPVGEFADADRTID